MCKKHLTKQERRQEEITDELTKLNKKINKLIAERDMLEEEWENLDGEQSQ